VGSVITASFVMTGVGSFYQPSRWHAEQAKTLLRVDVVAGLLSSSPVAAFCSKCEEAPLCLLSFSLPIPPDDTFPLRSVTGSIFGGKGSRVGVTVDALPRSE
jgi:hypothetical protein